MSPKEQFLIQVLSKSGYDALTTACKEPELLNLIFLRSIAGWVDVNGRKTYHDIVPGTTSKLFLTKSQNNFSGYIDIDNQRFDFDNKSSEYVSSLVAITLDKELQAFRYPKTEAIMKLGKSIDCLLKVNFAQQSLKKDIPQPGKSKDAAPVPAQNAVPPVEKQPDPQIQTKFTKKEKLLKKLRLKLKKNYLDIECNVCHTKMFTKNTFSGCECIDNTGTAFQQENGTPILVFGDNWSAEDVLELFEVLEDKNE